MCSRSQTPVCNTSLAPSVDPPKAPTPAQTFLSPWKGWELHSCPLLHHIGSYFWKKSTFFFLKGTAIMLHPWPSHVCKLLLEETGCWNRKKKAVTLVANFISISKDNSTLNMILICDMPLKLCYMLRMLTPYTWHALCPHLHCSAYNMNGQSHSELRESKSKQSQIYIFIHIIDGNYQGKKV